MTANRLNPASLPDAGGHFGRFGGRFVPETLMSPLIELEKAYRAARRDASFRRRLRGLLTSYAGRPTPLYLAERLTRHAGGALQNDDGQIAEAHSISAGLDYPGVGPEHSFYKDAGRFQNASVTDSEALEAFQSLARLEGIMPALESAHAVAYAIRAAATMKKSQSVVVGLSGRGDKDVHTVSQALSSGNGRATADGRAPR